MARSRSGMLLVTGCLAVLLLAVAEAAPARAASASVVPARSVAVTKHHSGYTTVSGLALVNVYRGAQVTVSADPSGSGTLEPAGSATGSSSGFLNLSGLVNDLRFRPGASIVLAIVYVPPGGSGESYSKNIRMTFSSGGSPSVSNDCSLTFAGQTLNVCTLPCPAPAGITVDYCNGVGISLHFHAEYPFVSTRRSVRLTDLKFTVLNLGSTIAVFCAPGRGGSCPAIEVYPDIRGHHFRVRGLIRRRLTPGTSIDILFYRGNYTGFSIHLDVVRGRRATIKGRRLCNYPDLSGPTRCTRPEG